MSHDVSETPWTRYAPVQAWDEAMDVKGKVREPYARVYAEIDRMSGDDLYARIAEHHEHTTVHCVFVDEAQFLEEAQVWQRARVADRLHIPVLCYGLRTDFQGNLFSGSRALLAIADELREVRTICRCGRKATMVVRLGPDGKVARQGEQVAIGKDVYVSLCRRHWEEEMGRAAPDDFIGFVRA